jgi:Ca2+-binding RTX toxin-like protein
MYAGRPAARLRAMISHKTILGLAAAAATLVPAASAQAAGTLSYQGDALHFTAVDASQTVMLDGDYASKVRFGGEDVTGAIPAGCLADEWGNSIECAVPGGGVVMTGGAGADSFFTGSATPAGITVTMIGGGGNDSFKDDTRDGRSVLRGGEGNDTLHAGPGNDDVDGEGGNDDVQGQAGSDAVRGGAGNDTMSGDAYHDPAGDVIDGGDGVDTIEEWTQPSNDFNPPVALSLDGVANDGRPGEGDNVTGVEQIVSHANGTFSGSDAAEKFTIWANIANGPSTVNGNGGDDQLTAMDYDDAMDGGAGNDRVEGGIGHDTITGGPGKDTLFGEGDGNYCGIYECKIPFGNDTINARDGEADQVDCGVGTDTAIVDALDTVANCEKVDVGAGSGPGGGGGGGGGAKDGLTVAAAAKRKTLLAKGLRLQMACGGACKVSAKLTLKGKPVGSGKRTLIAAGTANVTVKLSKAGKRKVRKLGKASLRLTVTVADAGGAARKLTRTVRVKR